MSRRLFAALFTRRAGWLAAAVLVGSLAAPQAWAWYRLRTARALLARHEPQAAREALGACAGVWGSRPSVRLLACRAAWQSGDADAAVAELRAAQRLTGGATDETAFEWALIRAFTGNVREVEGYLQRRADQTPDGAALVWEALAVGYLRAYRMPDAMDCLTAWLRADPDNVRALELRGATFVAGRGVSRALEDFRRVLELAPGRSETRWRLIDALLALGKYEEATEHLERFAREQPKDPAVAVRLTRCYVMIGRGPDAQRLIDEVIADRPDDAACLRTRGQIELATGRPAEAERTLRRAAELRPRDYQTQQLLFQAYQQQGKGDEARAQLRVAEGVRNQSERISELTSHKLAEAPLDPAVHYELGKLLVETDRAETGERWLLTALSLDPDHRPSHAALAAYYAGRGDKAKAEFHAARAAPKD